MVEVNDNIKEYLKGAGDGQKGYCPQCDCIRHVWVGITESDQILTVCGICQRILKRETKST